MTDRTLAYIRALTTAVVLVGLWPCPALAGTDEDAREYVAQEHKTLEDLLGHPPGEDESVPDWISTVELICPPNPVGQSSLYPEVNAYPLSGINGANVNVRLDDEFFSRPMVRACFYDGNAAANPSGCFGQGECTWNGRGAQGGGRADHVELWVPVVAMYSGSIVKGSYGDVYFKVQ